MVSEGDEVHERFETERIVVVRTDAGVRVVSAETVESGGFFKG
jgi:hypothetical protein